MNKLDQSMHMIDTITAFMDSNKKMFSQDIISTDDQIEVEELHRMMEQDKFDTNEYLRGRERDEDLEEKPDGFRGMSRRNDAWDKKEKDYL